MRFPIARLLAVLAFTTSPAIADDLVLDLPTTLARAGSGPAVAEARARGDEIAASRATVMTSNPELEVSAGPRFGDTRTTDIAVQLGQSFTLGRRGAARRRLVDAQVSQHTMQIEATMRAVQLEAALAYFDALHADQQIALAQRATELAQRGVDTAQRRRKAGDITDLDVDLAKAALGRARSQVRASEAERATAVGVLAGLVGASHEDVVIVRGELRMDATASSGVPLLSDLVAGVEHHPAVEILARERHVARAEGDVARTSARPEVGVWIGYEHEERSDIFLAGLRFELPFFQRAQGEKAIARAHEKRADTEWTAATRRIHRNLVDSYAAYERAKQAVDAFETDVLPALDDAEALLGKSLDAGQMSIADFLVARKELLDGRREYLERLTAHAKARFIAMFGAGGAL